VQLTTLVPRVLLINYVVRKSGVQREVSSRPPVKCRHNSLPALSTLHFSLVIKAQAGRQAAVALFALAKTKAELPRIVPVEWTQCTKLSSLIVGVFPM
jgi:hypothetical protein